jgi:MFS transporter, FHS family, L-fucose permease
MFAIGRFAAAGLMMVVKPRLVLMIFMSAIMLFIALAIGLYGETRRMLELGDRHLYMTF